MNEEVSNFVVKMCSRKSLGAIQQKVNGSITSDDNKIAKILSMRACPDIVNVDAYQGGAKASLEVVFEAVVCLENGEITTLESGKETSSITYENSLISQSSRVVMRPCIMDNETTISQGEIVINSLVNIDIMLIDNNCEFRPPYIEDGINIKTSENIICSKKDDIKTAGAIKGEIVLDSKFKREVFASYSGYIKSYEIKTDYFVINGEMLATLICEYEDGQLKTFSKSFEFSEEIEQKGIDKDDILQLDFKTGFRPKIDIITGTNGETIASLDMPYTLTGEIFTCYAQESIIDAYDLEKEVNTITESFVHNICKCSNFSEEKIIATFNLAEEAPRVERILGTAGENISLVNTLVKDGEMILEGIANVCAIYYSEDDEGNKVLNSVLIDLPYSLNILNKELKENDVVDISLKMGEVVVKNKKGRELEVIANVYVCYNIATPIISAFTTSITLGDQKLPPEYPLEIVVVKEGDSLWDVAKKLSVKEELLIAQNQNISLPLVGGEKLVVFRAKANID